MGVELRIEREGLAFILDIILRRMKRRVAKRQCDGRLLRFPDGIDSGIRSERDLNAGGLDRIDLEILLRVRVRHRPFCGVLELFSRDRAVGAPTEEGIAVADGNLIGELGVVPVTINIVVRGLRGGQVGHVVERVFVIGDRDGLALDAGDGDARVRGHIDEAERDRGDAFLRLDALAAQLIAVRRDGQLAVIVARLNDQVKRHIVAIRNGKRRVVRRCDRSHPRAAVLPVLQFPTIRRILHLDNGDLRLDGFIDRMDGCIRKNRVVEREDRRVVFLIITLELKALALRSRGHGGIIAVLDALDQERRLFRHCRGDAVCARRDLRDFERDLMHRVLRHRNGDVAVFLNFRVPTDFIGIGGCSGVVHFASLCRQRSFNRINYLGCLRRILAVNIHRKGERVMPVDGSHARRNGAIARAGGDRHRVGELFPDGVERDRRVVQILAARLIGHGAVRAGSPALEGVAVAGRVRHRQWQRNAMCLGLRVGNATDRRISVRVRVVVHGVGHRGQLAVDDRISGDLVRCIRLSECPRICEIRIAVPAIELIAGDLRFCRSGGRLSVLHALDGVQTGIRLEHVSHGVEHSLNCKRGNDTVARDRMRISAGDLAAVRQRQVLLAVDEELCLHARLRDKFDLECIAIFKCIGHGVNRVRLAAFREDRIESVAAREGDGERLSRGRIDRDRRILRSP